MESCEFQRSATQYSRSFAGGPTDQIAGPNVTGEYAIGEPEFECWTTLWKARLSDPDIDGVEWVTFLGQIEEDFRRTYENFPDEFYFWGDFSGDRTLDLKIVKPAVLTGSLLSDIQSYLQLNGQRMWRIRIPIYFQPNDPRRVIVVYADAIDIPRLVGTPSIEEYESARGENGDYAEGRKATPKRNWNLTQKRQDAKTRRGKEELIRNSTAVGRDLLARHGLSYAATERLPHVW